jgi:hypothetical protein
MSEWPTRRTFRLRSGRGSAGPGGRLSYTPKGVSTERGGILYKGLDIESDLPAKNDAFRIQRRNVSPCKRKTSPIKRKFTVSSEVVIAHRKSNTKFFWNFVGVPGPSMGFKF